MSSERRRRQRREIRLLEQESVWLQKALFAIGRAEDTHERLADLREEEPERYTFTVDDARLSAERLQDALQDRIQQMMDAVKAKRQEMR